MGEFYRETINLEIYEFDRYITIITLQRKNSILLSANTIRAICEDLEDYIRDRYLFDNLD